MRLDLGNRRCEPVRCLVAPIGEKTRGTSERVGNCRSCPPTTLSITLRLPFAARYPAKVAPSFRFFAMATASRIDSVAAPHIAQQAIYTPKAWHRMASVARCEKPAPNCGESLSNIWLRRSGSAKNLLDPAASQSCETVTVSACAIGGGLRAGISDTRPQYAAPAQLPRRFIKGG
jgi:hypothetical protein